MWVFFPSFWQLLKEMKHSTGEHMCLVTNEKLSVEVEQLKTALKATSEGIFFKKNVLLLKETYFV